MDGAVGAGTEETVCLVEHEPRVFLNVRRYIVFVTYFERGNKRNQREDEGSDIRQCDQGIKGKKNAVTAMNEIEEIDSLIILVVAQLSSELRFIVLVSSSMSASYFVPIHRFWQWG